MLENVNNEIYAISKRTKWITCTKVNESHFIMQKETQCKEMSAYYRVHLHKILSKFQPTFSEREHISIISATV